MSSVIVSLSQLRKIFVLVICLVKEDMDQFTRFPFLVYIAVFVFDIRLKGCFPIAKYYY
jgi:hypothetical protein